jgi:hypothetical protein
MTFKTSRTTFDTSLSDVLRLIAIVSVIKLESSELMSGGYFELASDTFFDEEDLEPR